jgi:hypothetical protein
VLVLFWTGHLNSQFLPNVGTVLSTSPMCSLYRIVVFPAASSPSITTLISLFPNILSNACLKDLNTEVADAALPMVANVFCARHELGVFLFPRPDLMRLRQPLPSTLLAATGRNTVDPGYVTRRAVKETREGDGRVRTEPRIWRVAD